MHGLLRYKEESHSDWRGRVDAHKKRLRDNDLCKHYQWNRRGSKGFMINEVCFNCGEERTRRGYLT